MSIKILIGKLKIVSNNLMDKTLCKIAIINKDNDIREQAKRHGTFLGCYQIN